MKNKNMEKRLNCIIVVCESKSQDFAENQNRETVTFRNSGSYSTHKYFFCWAW